MRSKSIVIACMVVAFTGCDSKDIAIDIANAEIEKLKQEISNFVVENRKLNDALKGANEKYQKLEKDFNEVVDSRKKLENKFDEVLKKNIQLQQNYDEIMKEKKKLDDFISCGTTK